MNVRDLHVIKCKTISKFLPSGHQFPGSILRTCEMRQSWLGPWCRRLPPHHRHGECQCQHTTLSGGTWWESIFLYEKKNIHTQGSTDRHSVPNGEWAIVNFKPWHTHSQNFERCWQISLNLEEDAFFKLLKLNLELYLVFEDISTYKFLVFENLTWEVPEWPAQCHLHNRSLKPRTFWRGEVRLPS